MSDPTSAVVAVEHGTNPVTGVDVYAIDFADGERQTHEGPWSEAREAAERAGLGHVEYGPAGVTRWARLVLLGIAAVVVTTVTACCSPPKAPEPPVAPTTTTIGAPR